MSWILFILFGLVIGLLARAIVPGRQDIGIIWTIVLGVAGSLLGGFVGRLITGAPMTDGLTTAGFIGSLIGAVVLLFAYVAFTRRRVRRHGHVAP
ncbi:MAG TPA: GlsB/YeaQ/YmgE family stress response membrane protein [Sandaracinaceae bacterium]